MIHAVGYAACLREPRIFDLWLTKGQPLSSRVHQFPRAWRCNGFTAPEPAS
ncbi:hypothetical protein ACRAWD_04405 [Caulobacter segnis]